MQLKQISRSQCKVFRFDPICHHKSTKENNEGSLSKIEEEIDNAAAQIWGLTKEELKVIQLSLKEVSHGK